MTLPVAVQRSQGVALQVVDFKVEPMLALANAAGIATLTTKRAVDPDQLWRVERLVVQSSSGNQLNLTVTDGTQPNDKGINLGLRDFGKAPAGYPQVAEYPCPMTLLGDQQFTLIASGAAAGDQVAATVQYMIVMRVPA